MPDEPALKRAIVFVDGQNLFHHAKTAFGYHYPNFDALKLAETVCRMRSWNLVKTHFYTGVPDAADDPFWNQFWTRKLAAMGRQGIEVFSRPLRYHNRVVKLPDGTQLSLLHGEEKGIDVRIALDIIRLASRGSYDVAIAFSQDQDLSEVADDIREISKLQNRWIKMACAFPVSPTTTNRRGINRTDWIGLDRATYAACLDPADYRPKVRPAKPPAGL
ncbi:MAG: NYN domain-containing protein [Acidobacteriota bacterium]|nr:NYN domain-containing protein [Acidobacteriota bacterium]